MRIWLIAIDDSAHSVRAFSGDLSHLSFTRHDRIAPLFSENNPSVPADGCYAPTDPSRHLSPSDCPPFYTIRSPVADLSG